MTDWRAEGGDDADRDLASVYPPGTLIGGKYQVQTLIGRGGMGSVWAAIHLGLGQRVAVKLISRRYAASREARQRFDLEAKAVAQLRSRHVVQVYDNGETSDGTPYIVMELLEGESLDQRIKNAGPMPLDAALRITQQVSRALGRAHSMGIIHRDLKPENIFLTRSQDDDEEIAKVLDFGIAKIKRTDGSSSSTRTGAVLGTPLFMSPEQARGLKSVDHRTDIYSLGMVVYMMLTGQPAFSGDSFGDILVAICTQPLPPIRSVAPWLPEAMETWLARACAREPADRYPTPEALVEGLFAASGQRRPAAQSQEIPMMAESAVDPRVIPAAGRTSPGAHTAAVAATQASVGRATGTGRTTSAVSLSAEQIPRRSLLVPVLAASGVLVIVVLVAALVILRKQTGTREVVASGGQVGAVSAVATPSSVPTPSAIATGTAAPAEPPSSGAAASAALPAKNATGSSPAAAKPAAARAKAPGEKPSTGKSKSSKVDLGF